MNRKAILFIVVCLLGYASIAQSLTGRWQWTLQAASGKDIQTDYLIELDLKQEGNRVYGLRTLYLKNLDDVVVSVEGTVSPTGEVTIHSSRVVQCSLPDTILLAKSFTYKLQKLSGSAVRLDGTFFPKEDTASAKFKNYDPELYEQVFIHSYPAPFRKLADTLSEKARQRMGLVANAPAKTQPALVTDVQSRLTLPFTNVSIDLYDNGEVDGDSITLLVNEKVVAANQRLSTHSIHFDLKKEDFTDTTTVIMRAENLGGIPPNTALMLITAAGIRHDVRLSSDLKRQAAVVLYRRKE
jgi:hypothetical protein